MKLTEIEIVCMLRRIKQRLVGTAGCDRPSSCTGDCAGCRNESALHIVNGELAKQGVS